MTLRNILSFRKKYYLLLQLQRFKSFAFFKNSSLKAEKKYAFLFLAADYGNLGDVAITYAQTKFLKKHGYEVFEIPISESLEGIHFVKKHITPKDLVTTVGGGNIGDLYDQIEYIRQLVFRTFTKNKVISFPQTFDFADSKKGRLALSRAKKAYNQHPNLVLVAREKTSFKLMQKHFKNAKIILTPDIVLSLDKSQPVFKRKGVVFTLRKDAEKNISRQQEDFVVNKASAIFKNALYQDTHIDKQKMSIDLREKELNKIWETFKNAELVITDRLHGMIFCYITNTPCMVFQNNNHKVKETHDWIKDQQNVYLQTDFNPEKIISGLKRDIKPGTYHNLASQFRILSQELV